MDDLRNMCFTIVESYRKVIVEDDQRVIQGMKEQIDNKRIKKDE